MNFIARYFVNNELNKLQEQLADEYKTDGLSNELLDKQVAVNSIRSMLNIPDDNEKIYKNFTQ